MTVGNAGYPAKSALLLLREGIKREKQK